MRTQTFKTFAPSFSRLHPTGKTVLHVCRKKRKELEENAPKRKKKTEPSPQRMNILPALEELALYLEIDLLLGQKERFKRRLRAAMR